MIARAHLVITILKFRFNNIFTPELYEEFYRHFISLKQNLGLLF